MSFTREAVARYVTGEGWCFEIDGVTKGELGPFDTAKEVKREMANYPNPGALMVFCDDPDALADWNEA